MKTYLYQILISGICLLFIMSCTKKKKETYDFSDMPKFEILDKDPHSQSNFHQVQVKHLLWDAQVDLYSKQMEATATWKIENPNELDHIIFDTKGLDILSVTLNQGEKTQFELFEEVPILGRALHIEIFPNTETISIYYKTTNESDALQWLEPQQTADKKYPLVYTQSQAIAARSWIPCMDGPGIRFTYEANVSVPEGFLAIMSAKNAKEIQPDGKYHFEMQQPIPSYLLALTVGMLDYRKLGSNTGIFAEQSVIDRAANEFSDLPEMMKVAQNLYGPYRWDDYDILVLPPAFPFGGMENPRLTFLTPTLIAGDKSLTYVLAHELAHSWSGNLVTNATWDDFWLNEGFTVYFEHRIMEEVFGKDFSEMLAVLSYQGLQRELLELDDRDQHLLLHLKGREPDDAITSVPYDKGYLFLRTLEEAIGREKLDAFLKSYFNTYSFQIMDTKHFVRILDKMIIKDDFELSKTLKVNEWINQPGLPEGHAVPFSTLFEPVQPFLSQTDVGKLREVSKDWNSLQWTYFLSNLPRELPLELMEQLEYNFNFSKSQNAEIQFAWFQLVILNRFQPAYPFVEDFLMHVGRNKFVVPLYKDMVDSGQKEWALKLYESARANYHPITQRNIDKIFDSDIVIN